MVKQSTKLIDADGYGLKEEKEMDKKYLGYIKAIDKYYDSNKELVDLKIQHLINIHITLSEYFCNGLLVLKRLNIVTKITKIPDISEFMSPAVQANLEGLKREIEGRLNEIRVMIAEYINKLEKKQWELIVNTADQKT
jgi:hypothetical protein